MKFDCGETYSEKLDRLVQWHPWFAWHPVKIGKHDCRWLETVERRITYFDSWDGMYSEQEYRARVK